MNPAVVAELRSWALDAIAQGLESVAASWFRLNVDRLPVRSKTLESLQRDYQELWEPLPDCTGEDIERLLQGYARAMHLDDERVTTSQSKFLEARLRLTKGGSIAPQLVRMKPSDDTWEWLQPVFRHPGSLVQGMTMASALYVVSQRSLGACLPTFTEAFRDELCTAEVQQAVVNRSGHVQLLPLIKAHSRWLALSRTTTNEEADTSLQYDLI
jgi:hypothetical protein